MTAGQDHERYKLAYLESEPARQHIAEYLRRTAVQDVVVHPMRVAQSYEDRLACLDQGDIIVTSRQGTPNCVVEVKHAKKDFACVDDWEYDMLLVNEIRKVERTRPICHYTVSRDGWYALYLPTAETRAHWTRFAWMQRDWNQDHRPCNLCQSGLPMRGAYHRLANGQRVVCGKATWFYWVPKQMAVCVRLHAGLNGAAA